MSVDQFPNIVDPGYIRAQVVLKGPSGLPEDDTVNTWHFVVSTGEDYLTNIQSALQSAYDTLTPFYSGEVARTGALVKYYDMELPKPAPPIDTQSLTVTAKGASLYDLPSEVALCMSYKAPAVAGQIPARTRGRMYFGPWAVGSATDMSRPWAAIIDIPVTVGEDMLVAAGFADTIAAWAVYSPTSAGGWAVPGGSGPPNFAGAVFPVTEGWVDDSWDTQRRRGLAPTARTTF